MIDPLAIIGAVLAVLICAFLAAHMIGETRANKRIREQ